MDRIFIIWRIAIKMGFTSRKNIYRRVEDRGGKRLKSRMLGACKKERLSGAAARTGKFSIK